ncbi:hypothetical protein ACGFXC_03610 [Streptomyces sp. NPDC048507]|uniref:hypothetical protein n=1 Tax=Streptomyces sp. NPDC048507 TaxID=3365560 RepID=UPI00371B9DD2
MSALDAALSAQVASVNRLVGQVAGQVDRLSGQVASVHANQHQTRTELQQLRDEFRAFAMQARLAAALQRAETRVGVIQDRLDHEFGHHKVVRRTAVGMLQAFDTGLVSEEAVRAVGDQLMLQTPRYWLAPALVALAAWSADDQALCARAVQEAFRRAPDRTSLLFALVLRRQGRHAESARWLRHYLLAQDPAALGREFAVILESVAQGAFGAAGRAMLREALERWHGLLGADTGAQNTQIERWGAELRSLCPVVDGAEFPYLRAVSPQWPQLAGVLSGARGQQAVLDKYTAITNLEPAPTQRLEDAVDDILDRLVSEYDDEELPLRRDLAYQEAVITHDGDTARARTDTEADASSYDESLDYLTVQSTAALNPAAIGTSEATRRLAVAACRDWFHHAHQGFGRDYRAVVPQDVRARFGAAYPVGAQRFTLPAWEGSYQKPLPELERELGEHWDRHTAPFVASLGYKYTPAVALAVLVCLVALFLGGGGGGPAGAVMAVLIVGGIAWLIIRGLAGQCRRAQDSARQILDRAKRAALEQLVGARADLTAWQHAYEDADAVEARVADLIASLDTGTEGNSPFSGRTVTPEGPRT